MLRFVIRRLLIMIPTIWLISVVSFIIIQLPPGDFLTAYAGSLAARGQQADRALLDALSKRYGLNQPGYVQYFKWLWSLLHFDLGQSMQYEQPVARLLGQRIPWSILISLLGMLLLWVISIPIGIFSATHQYSIGDYVWTVLGFIGLGVPSFLLALIYLYVYFLATGSAAVGLFSYQYQSAPWSVAKVLDLLRHVGVPAAIVAFTGTAATIRVVRANLLDELQKPYVLVARAKGLSERRLLLKYPFRIALNPIMSTIGWSLPGLVSGELLVSLVLSVPTVAPLYIASLRNQDMYLAGSVVMVLSSLTVIGTLISDLLLAWVDPRIRGAV